MRFPSTDLPFRAVIVVAALASTSLAAAPTQASRPAHAAQSCADTQLVPTAANAPAVRRATLCLLNAQRRTRHLRALTSNSRLRRAAQSYAEQMVQQNFFAHVSPAGSTMVQRIQRTTYLSTAKAWTVGENLAWATGSLATPAQTVDNWMNSPAHRRNVLNREFREIGIGVAIGAPSTDQAGATYTTEFGHRA